MKNSAGRWVIFSFIIVSIAVGIVLYRTFKGSGDYKELILAQMHKEFVGYTVLKQGQERFPVAQVGSKTYYVDLRKPWSFSLHDKLLIAKPPAIEPLPEPAVKAEVEQQALQRLNSMFKVWLVDKFHTLDNINFKVEF